MLRRFVGAAVVLALFSGGLLADDKDKPERKKCDFKGVVIKINKAHDIFEVKDKNGKLHFVHCSKKCVVLGPQGGKHDCKYIRKGDRVHVVGFHVKKHCECREIKVARRVPKKDSAE